MNYGRVEDFQKLKNLGVNMTGKIAIMRYGKIFRGNKVTSGDHTTEVYGDVRILSEQNKVRPCVFLECLCLCK